MDRPRIEIGPSRVDELGLELPEKAREAETITLGLEIQAEFQLLERGGSGIPSIVPFFSVSLPCLTVPST